MTSVNSSDPLRRALVTLLKELLYGSSGDAYVLNRGDAGLLASLDRLSADAASAQPNGASSVAAHVDHLRYGFELLNRFARGENPWTDADYAASWRRQHVTDAQWRQLRESTRAEAAAWLAAVADLPVIDDVTAAGMLSSAVHLAYHVGAIRQVAAAARGPRATD